MKDQQIETLCSSLQLGEIVNGPVALSGGLMHRMFEIVTTTGKYVIKALNPEIMRRPTAMQNYVRSEHIANAAAAAQIPGLPAKQYHGTSIQQVDQQFYLVFDWIPGRSLRPDEIQIGHCEKIGSILADIHRTDFSALNLGDNNSEVRQLVDWKFYLDKGQESHSEWVGLLLETLDKLKAWDNLAIESAKLLTQSMVVSHGDLDSKNVLWNQDQPVLIDWESAGYRNPMQDLIETALYWSEDEHGEVDKQRFFAFLSGYRRKGGTLQANWSTVLANGFLGKLNWLEYSLKRSLWIECTDEREQQLGTEQVSGTINAIKRYSEKIDEIEQWLQHP
ncbi:phosphotransferase [Paenibacillus agri]|uniref:Aminoglycoside phosphotransferase family protein n=1 Tax=Paenibacillus agri TaxID=2744309 RepID=A0A850ES10_9BACL|nr:phosphotransferase [Paenibacillus agri]NUU62034.1 aminoglycoside phosphotransferase family protein [Paenibacillus agri]